MRYWLRMCVVCLVLLAGLTGDMLSCGRRGERVRALLMTDSGCTHYADNQASRDGNGSLRKPWDNIAGHVNDLLAGDVLCVRGDTSAPGRVYDEPGVLLQAASATASGMARAPITLRTYPGEHVVLHSSEVGYIISLAGVSHWHIDGFVLDKEGEDGYGIVFREADFNVVRNCEIHNGSHEGIHFTSGEGNLVEGCKIHDMIGPPYRDAHGILIQGGQNTVIRGNEIYDCTGNGIQLWDTGDNIGTVIENNHIYTTLGPCSEVAVGVKRGNPVIRGNVMHGFRYADGSCGGTGGAPGPAIKIGKQAADVLIEGNEIYDCASGIMTDKGEVRIINNVIHDLVTDPDGWWNGGLHINTTKNGAVDVLHNTLVNLPEDALWIGQEVDDLNVINNIFYNTGRIRQIYPESQVAADYNGWFNAAERLVGRHDVVGDDPGFLMPAGDYHLRVGSPARDTGEEVGVQTDFEGDPRPMGIGADIGADEHMPGIHLMGVPDDGTIRLLWTGYEDPDLASYVITYTYQAGGSDASQGPSPILDVLTTTQAYTLSEVTNYVLYTVIVAGRDEGSIDLAVSNAVRVIPTDIFFYLPLIIKGTP